MRFFDRVFNIRHRPFGIAGDWHSVPRARRNVAGRAEGK
jgi:hypothetical protein